MDQPFDLIEELIAANCIQIGNFTLKNGSTSKYYFDMKNLISYPLLMAKIGDLLFPLLGEFDIICGIPYGALPLASYISTKYNKPMIYVRDKAKQYGTNKRIEGEYSSTSRCVILDDVMTSGGSIEEMYRYLEGKMNIVNCAVILDRQQSGVQGVISLLTKTDIMKYRIQKLRKEKRSDLCFSADLMDLPKLWSIIEQIGKHIIICKIHYDMIPEEKRFEYRDRIIELSIQHNFLIMEDRKFNDISFIVKQQYDIFKDWVDLVTVHTLVSSEVIKELSGVVLIANMSNNTYDYSEQARVLANNHIHHVIGFVSQHRISNVDTSFLCMTPGISLYKMNVNDQSYRTSKNVDADIKIVGRAIYQSENIISDTEKLLTYNDFNSSV